MTCNDVHDMRPSIGSEQTTMRKIAINFLFMFSFCTFLKEAASCASIAGHRHHTCLRPGQNP